MKVTSMINVNMQFKIPLAIPTLFTFTVKPPDPMRIQMRSVKSLGCKVCDGKLFFAKWTFAISKNYFRFLV